jgi:hypothetical protein
MDVQHALRVLAPGVYRAVDGEAGRIDVVRAVQHLAPGEVDLDEARRGDLVEHHPVRVDEEVMLGAGHARRDVGEDQVIPAVMRHQAIARREIDALFPLHRADLRPHPLGGGIRSGTAHPC